MTVDCQNLDNLPAVLDDYWDVMPKSIRVNCSLEDITFPLTVYGVERDQLEYRVLNQDIASVSSTGEVTLGTVRGVTMIAVQRKGDPCNLRYIQVSVECPCDEYLPGARGAGGGDASQPGASTPAGDCDGAESMTMIVSGFHGACLGLNGAYLLRRAASHVWVDAARTVQVRRYADRWRVEVGTGTEAFAEDYPAPLSCRGDHPAGSGTLLSAGCRESGQYTIA